MDNKKAFLLFSTSHPGFSNQIETILRACLDIDFAGEKWERKVLTKPILSSIAALWREKWAKTGSCDTVLQRKRQIETSSKNSPGETCTSVFGLFFKKQAKNRKHLGVTGNMTNQNCRVKGRQSLDASETQTAQLPNYKGSLNFFELFLSQPLIFSGISKL